MSNKAVLIALLPSEACAGTFFARNKMHHCSHLCHEDMHQLGSPDCFLWEDGVWGPDKAPFCSRCKIQLLLYMFLWSFGPSDQRMLLRTKGCLKCQKWSPYKVKGAFSTLACARKQTNGPPGNDQGFSTGSCNGHHALSARGVHPPTPHFLLAQNLSSKRIAPTDNMRPKTDDAKSRHQLLKG